MSRIAEQITEDYVSYEIAKLLKEKGFNENTLDYYDKNGKVVYGSLRMKRNDFNDYARPTHQMALKWLREVHRKHICVRMRDFPTQYEIEVYDTKTGYLCHADFEYSFDSYEKAVEAVLLYVLKNLI